MQTSIIKTQPRIESKYNINSKGVNRFLDVLIKYGFVERYSKRKIFSLYYDDYRYTSVSDNLSGISPRSKYRLRWYCNLEGEEYGLRYEQKIKKGILGIKKIISLKEFKDQIANNCFIKNIRNLSRINDEKFFPLNYQPQIFCNYNRRYYENVDGIRLTIDKDLRFWSYKKDYSIFEIRNYYQSSNSIIIELKFEKEQQNSINSLLRLLPSTSIRCSKYLLGQSKLKNFSYL